MSCLSLTSPASYRGNRGILKIENRSLVFIKRSGIMNPRDYIVQTIPLRAIRSMATSKGKANAFGMRTPVLTLITDPSKMSGIPRHEFGVASPKKWMSAIQGEIDQMKREASRMDNSPKPTYVKEIVREIVKYPCPYCRSLIEVTSERCPSCGAPQSK